MDRPERDANGKFEGGLFSGAMPEDAGMEQSLRADDYFDNAYREAQQHFEQNSSFQRKNEPYSKEEPDYDRCSSCKYRRCSEGREMGDTVRALFILLWVVIAALTIAFLATVFCLVKVSSRQSEQKVSMDDGGRTPYIENAPPKGNSEYREIPTPDIGDRGDYYGEIEDAIRTDLNYSIQWENYEYEGNNDNVMIAVDYPVIEGNVPNLDAINGIIADETEYFAEYYEEYSRYMMPEERFLAYSEGYVTFMDQEMMSVVFCEMIYTDYWTDYGLYCLNIDIENGIVLDNSSIMEIDDEFVVDFRKRCRQQNGTVSGLDNLTDQEIAYYLTSGGTSILFYTPVGMEVGINFGDYYVTVTYKDYERFLQKY